MRYARALLKGATDARKEDVVYRDMLTLAASFAGVPQLRQTLAAPMLPKDSKQALLTTAAGEAPSELTVAFLGIVLDNGREDIVQFMANSYITLYRKQKNIIRGKLITAAAVHPATEQKMRSMVTGRTNGTVEFETEVNPDIIGGFILEYDTYRMDASVRNRLNTILTALR